MNLDIIFRRRSIRHFENRPVAPELVNELLRAAMSAPSAGNEQPWQFVVITRRDLLDRIAHIHPHAAMAEEAQVAILVCGDLDREIRRGFWVQDCSAATENLLLAAAGLGLGAVWCGVHPREDREQGFRSLLGIPQRVVPFALVPIGWPAEDKGTSDRYDASRIYFDAWGARERADPDHGVTHPPATNALPDGSFSRNMVRPVKALRSRLRPLLRLARRLLPKRFSR